MNRGTTTVDPQLLDEAGQGPSDIGRPLVPSDPWTAGWAPPSEDTLAHKHALARKRERRLARTGYHPLTPDETEGLPSREPPIPISETHAATSPARDTVGSSRMLGGIAAVATAYWYYLLASIVIAIAIPLAAGWDASTVITGSMEPSISAGDVVSFSPYDGADLAPGTIVQFRDPSHAGETVTHRIVGRNPDGTYTTKGDANAAADSTPLPPSEIIGVAELIAPHAGLPQMWLAQRMHGHLAIWAVITVGAIVVMAVHTSRARRVERPRRARSGRSILRPAMAVGLVAAMAGVGTAAWSQGRFAAAAGPAPSTFQSASSFVHFEHGGSLGVVTCSTTSQSTVTLTQGVAADSTIVIRFALRDLLGGAGYAASDTAGNTYSIDGVASDGTRTEVAIVTGTVTTPLTAGDQITLSHPDGRATATSFDVFTGIDTVDPVVSAGAATGNDWGATITAITAEAPVLTVAQVAVRDIVTIAQPAAGWDPLESGPVSCDRDLTHRAAWNQQYQPGTVTYDPTFDSNKKVRWSGLIVVYRTG